MYGNNSINRTITVQKSQLPDGSVITVPSPNTAF